MQRARQVALFCAVALVGGAFASTDALATVVQVDGTIVPTMTGDSCLGNMQVCLDQAEGVSGTLDAVLDAAQLPEIFLPNTGGVVTFVDIAEGAGFENSFGYYNVGDDVTNTANLHPIFGCGVPASTHTGEAGRHGSPLTGGYVQSANAGADDSNGSGGVPKATTTVDFAVELAGGRYKGGFIGFYLIAPEGRPDGVTNCGDFAGSSYFGRTYFTQRDLNNDGDFVHHLVYQSRLPGVTDRFYFGFEDLFRGGDNDFEDMLIQVTGLTPPCVPGLEVCNGRDDDCDLLVDGDDPSLSDDGVACTCDGISSPACEGGGRDGICQQGATVCEAGVLFCRSSVSPAPETCNDLDDNCNGSVDDSPIDAGASCDGSDADLCHEGFVVCSGGELSCSDGTGANEELCNGGDDDCDGATDEDVAGLGVACDGADGDLCAEGVTTCAAGALACSDVTDTTGELCNGADDDCDGSTDESPSGVGVACSVGVGACQRSGATVCAAGAPVCNVVPGAGSDERCNALDDDCDGAVDETFMLGSACVGLGACGVGVIECAGPTGTRCSSAPGGSMDASMPEACNGLDDDCDGDVDEGLTDLGSCGTSTGECEPGRLRCLAATPTCVGGVGPTPETCNGLDDDCDGASDDDPVDAGASCGSDVGECRAGTEVCTGGSLVCTGAVGPSGELCNALDDNCDGISDNAPTDVGAPCGTTDVGVCDLGATICVAGSPVCAGATDPSAELCNGDDDDCDGTTDEDPIDVGRTCGSAMGTCTPGTTICDMGTVVCDGATAGAPEECNGIDDDCDTRIDESPVAGEGVACGMAEGVCEEGAIRCIAGSLQCVGGVLPGTEVCNGIDDDCNGTIDDGELCAGGVCRGGRCSVPCIVTEFGGRCPPGDRCVDGFCVEDACFGVECERGEDGTGNVCQDGECVPVCETLSCDAPNVCRRTDGACVGNNCIFLPYLCTDAEICVAGECMSDPCAGVSCGTAEFCREGDCVGSCAGIECGFGDVCRGGTCESSGCETDCGSGRVCDRDSGECIEDPCRGMVCETGQVCDPAASACVDDPCRNIECPGDELCRLGECYARPSGVPDGGPLRADAGPERVIAAGGVGCSASSGPAQGHLGWLALIALVLVARRRRSAVSAALSVALPVALALTASGCEVEPFCLERCGEDGGVDGGQEQVDSDVVIPDGGPIVTDGCVLGATDECNEADDDCDGFVDEDIDLTSDGRHCGACGVSCDRTGAQTECSDSVCGFVACFDGFIDLNGDTAGPFEDTDGCEYRCFESNGGVEACDTIDNDCDGDVDEDYDLDGDEANCGRCGQVCTFFRVTAATCESGVCTFDESACVPGYIDANDIDSDGCEFECTPSASGVEECNGLDDDCDGTTDEGFDLDADVSNCGRCGRVCTFPHATPSCTTGACGFDPTMDCEPGFSDDDGVQLNGCEYPCTPTADPTEICDGLDNDCDGRVDGATTDAGGSCNEAPSGVATGVCTDTGVVTCLAGSLACVGAPEPTVERCNGLDDDCDGTPDDTPIDEGRVCMPAVGTCTAGFSVCNAGTLDCERAVGPVAETCNGLDDDCNGTEDDALTDPGIGMTCGIDTGACVSGTLGCTDGRLTCAGSVGATLETCNGADDDCDGTIDDDPIDEGGSCGSSIGACVPGSEACVGGALVCMGGAGATSETCDGQDDDCDGSVDESLTRGCYTGAAATRGVGACRDGTQACSGGTFGACAGQVLPSPETCDGVDQDCDMAVDEGVVRSCYTGPAGTAGVGLCRAGMEVCSGGGFGACLGQVGPVAEICDGLDQDCDGRVDEATGGGPLVRSCYGGPAGTAGTGTCVAGTETCRFGAFDVCVGAVTPSTDYCGDGIDTDCDTLNDVAEGCLSAGGELRVDASTAHSYDVRIASSPLTSNVYAVWVDKANGSSAADIFFSRSTNGGDTWSAPVDLTSSEGDRAVRPEIVVGRSGGQDVVHVAYQVVPIGGTASERVRHIWVRSSTNSGSSFASAQQLDQTGSTDNFKHSIATNATGAAVVVAWEQLDTGDLDRNVVSRASVDSGGFWADERLVSRNVAAAATAGEPVVAIVTGASGSSGYRFVFAWREARPGTRDTFDVYTTYSDFASAAIPATRERRLDSDLANTRASDDLRIATAGDAVYLVWVDVSTAMGGGADIVFVRSPDGLSTSWTAEKIIDDPGMALSDSSEATIAVDPRAAGAGDDRVFVAWTDTSDGTQIGFASSSDGGLTFSAAARASQQNGAVPGVSDSPRIAFGGGDAVIIAYVNDANGSATRQRVRAAVSIDAGLTWQTSDPVVDAGGGEAEEPAIARVSGSGLTVGAAIAWIDYRRGTRVNGDVYRVRVGR